MSDFDYKKFLSADEQTRRTMIAEVTREKPYKHDWFCGDAYDSAHCLKCSSQDEHSECLIPDPVTDDFRILAFELAGKVSLALFRDSLIKLHKEHKHSQCSFEQWIADKYGGNNPAVIICAALMAWPERKEDEQT